MNKQFLKKIRDQLPEPLKLTLGPLFRNKLIKNSHYLKYEQLLNNKEHLSSDEIQAYQHKKLKTILVHAFENVPYYRKIFNDAGFSPYSLKYLDEIRILPFLTKDVIRNNFNELISEKKISGGHYIATTGGTTGEPLKVLLDYDCVFKENAFVNHFRKKIGYCKNDLLATFRGITFGNRLWKYNPMQMEFIFSPFRLSKITINDYLKKINHIAPSFLCGYLSALYFFANLLAEKNLQLKNPIKGIFLISENIDRGQRIFLEEFFQVETKTFYGHTERCIIAEEIYPNKYLFDHNYGYTEFIDNNEGYLTICGTGFLNKTMPLIRYKTDDVCLPCGDGLYEIFGRRKSTEGLYGINGEFFGHVFNFHSEIFKNVTNYQFVQSQKGKADLLLLVNDAFHPNEIDKMEKEIDKKTKGVIAFDIKVVDKLILSDRGKYRMFTQLSGFSRTMKNMT